MNELHKHHCYISHIQYIYNVWMNICSYGAKKGTTNFCLDQLNMYIQSKSNTFNISCDL